MTLEGALFLEVKSRTQKWLKSEGGQSITFCSNWSVHAAWRSGECQFTGGVCALDLSPLLTSCLLWPSTTLWCPKKSDNCIQDSFRHHLLKFLPGIKSGLMTLNLSPDKKTIRLPGNAKVNNLFKQVSVFPSYPSPPELKFKCTWHAPQVLKYTPSCRVCYYS